jgi:uroporphyrinogen-III synthase
MRALISRHGGDATVAPSMREVPLEENQEAFEFAEKLLSGHIGVVVFMTGVGARTLMDALEVRYARAEILHVLSACQIIVRGPKPAAVLRDWKLRVDYRAPEPNTWRELLSLIDEHVSVAEKTVAVQEYGRPNEKFYDELRRRGATVLRIPVYRWAFPEETGPLLAAIDETINGRFDVLLFTSANQLENVLQATDADGKRDAWIAAASRCVIGSIGPTSSEALVDAGLRADVEASPPKMGQLVRQTLEAAPVILSSRQP